MSEHVSANKDSGLNMFTRCTRWTKRGQCTRPITHLGSHCARGDLHDDDLSATASAEG